MHTYKDRIAETERVKEKKRARVERGAGDVPMEPRNRDNEQMAIRHHPHSEAASEEQPDKLRKTIRFEQEASSAASPSNPAVLLEQSASRETQDRSGSVLVQKSGHVDDDVQFFFVGCVPRDGWTKESL